MAPSESELSPDQLRERWNDLRDILGASSSGEVLRRVQELQLDAMQEAATVAAASLDSDEAATLLDRVKSRIAHLRSRTERWQALLADLDAETLTEAQATVSDLRERLRQYEEDAFSSQLPASLKNAGISSADEALAMIESMETQLQELYEDKEMSARAEDALAQEFEGEDTYDQLQRLLAREERLQRELGVTSSEEVIEMVRGLATQLDELYADRDDDQRAAGTEPEKRSEHEQQLENALGVSDPEDVIHMVNGLVQQLEELYDARERLSRVNLDDAESVITMVSNMEAQLEALYDEQVRMSEQGIESVDQAISMIESMESQLEALYDERHSGNGSIPEEAQERVERLERKLDELTEEKQALLEQREALVAGESSMDTLERELGLSDPQHIVDLIESMQQQLQDVYTDRETDEDRDSNARTSPAGEGSAAFAEPGIQSSEGDSPDPTEPAMESAKEIEPVVPPDELDLLPRQSQQILDGMGYGIIRVDDEGRVGYANDAAAAVLPGVTGTAQESMIDRNFFFSLAPGANSSMFRGRFKSGVEAQDLNVLFPYTFIHPTEPAANLVVQLYRSERNENWILIRPLS